MLDKSGIEAQLAQLAELSPKGYFVGLHIRFAAPLYTFQTYDQAWINHYTAQAYAMRDPMIAWGFSMEGATRWSELEIPDPFGIMDEAAKFGLRFGASVSCGPISSRTIAGIARADREYEEDEIATAIAIIRRLHDITEPPDSLTQAQIDALRLIAAGDRHAAAAAKLNISESALKARLTAARQRLLARTTAEALQRAKEYRLL
ncbi:LuxR family transcriptional regulator [Pacificitalea manganoxidans]|uniref:LuxR family transcriptional regulator n=1 Tax=Pacificitalea manganoxidans TaxID=1411902 RepID=A0A291M234_9RHOB|nr:autoinducer binding domain-containing protein [Pacificitalea manganoxidans]MAQ45577.1 LuxR family transcriptional regulator [Actibacterium sp.]OWU67164.1 LuxR family transcriptional regulator [Roseovarius sp. 22II1-1F6A]ATI42917.1 LuxR family transcriptional regulator [Pacificitalea manganoxidans]MBF54343.1 LuxR family transcriptional regulator [Actibacterium sp.]MDR6307165.1 LuxR family transcriptional regulator [Pacificitalea manganoxidans]|tara:strand:- start:967 stop:1578 length:612 start_codon:yes stop_codon:yes gene_type:complete